MLNTQAYTTKGHTLIQVFSAWMHTPQSYCSLLMHICILIVFWYMQAKRPVSLHQHFLVYAYRPVCILIHIHISTWKHKNFTVVYVSLRHSSSLCRELEIARLLHVHHLACMCITLSIDKLPDCFKANPQVVVIINCQFLDISTPCQPYMWPESHNSCTFPWIIYKLTDFPV